MTALPAALEDTLGTLPDTLRLPVRSWAERFCDAHGPAGLSPPLLRLAATSEFVAATLLRQWPEYREQDTTPFDVLDGRGLRARLANIAESGRPIADVKRDLRRLRNRYLASIIARECGADGVLTATLSDWSDFADAVLEAAARYAAAQVRRRFGEIVDAEGAPLHLAILAMGKLGGRELNLSSDIDIVYLYTGEGESTGKKSVSAETWFTRQSQQIAALIDEVTADGFVFRVDTRLRPFGDSGPPVTSLAALESYLIEHGRTWERYAYVKARLTGPELPAGIADELTNGLIRPFVFRGYLDYGILESLRDMHGMIASEGERRDLSGNLKLGPGGIREIEFIVQSLQLLRGGADERLATPSLLSALAELKKQGVLPAADCDQLKQSYALLRRVENAVQAIRDRQTHDLPANTADQSRVALALGAPDWATLAADVDEARSLVKAQFAKLAFQAPVASDASRGAIELWQAGAGESEWRHYLDGKLADAAAVAAVLVRFRHDPDTAKAGAAASGRLQRLLPLLLDRILAGSEPERTLERVIPVLTAVVRRSAYLALLIENPGALARLVNLCRQSRYIAAELAQFPVLLDELIATPDTPHFGRAELAAAARERLDREDRADLEVCVESLAQFQRATMFRIAVADFNGSLPIMKVSDALTWLAEAVLNEALSLAWAELVVKHGVPRYTVDGERVDAGFGIIAYGKLGGLELSYGSDLDIVFLHDSRGSNQQTDGRRPLDNAVFFVRLARRLIHFLTTRTRAGVLYEIDTRLRPSGRKGLLVSSLEAFARYQKEDAWTWEHQALLRARAVAGSERVAGAFEQVRRETLRFSVRRHQLRGDVIAMRSKMRAGVDRSSAEAFDLKHGHGGLGDIEFLVQYLVLANAASHPELTEYSDNIRQLDALAGTGVVSVDDVGLLQELYRTYRHEVHRLTLDEKPAIVAIDGFPAEKAAVRRLWAAHLGESSDE